MGLPYWVNPEERAILTSRAENLLLYRVMLSETREEMLTWHRPAHIDQGRLPNPFTLQDDQGTPISSPQADPCLRNVYNSVIPWIFALVNPAVIYLKNEARTILQTAYPSTLSATGAELTYNELHQNTLSKKDTPGLRQRIDVLVQEVKMLHIACVNGDVIEPLNTQQLEASKNRLDGFVSVGVATLTGDGLIADLLKIHGQPRAARDNSWGRQRPGEAGTSIGTSSNSPQNRSRPRSRTGSSSRAGRSSSTHERNGTNPLLLNLPREARSESFQDMYPGVRGLRVVRQSNM